MEAGLIKKYSKELLYQPTKYQQNGKGKRVKQNRRRKKRKQKANKRKPIPEPTTEPSRVHTYAKCNPRKETKQEEAEKKKRHGKERNPQTFCRHLSKEKKVTRAKQNEKDTVKW